MVTHEKWLRHDAWQEVVDGQLTRGELQALVALCEKHPELWRRCAIAFLEEQALEQELKGLASNWPPATNVTASGGVGAGHCDFEFCSRGDERQVPKAASIPAGQAADKKSRPASELDTPEFNTPELNTVAKNFAALNRAEPNVVPARPAHGLDRSARNSSNAPSHSVLLNNLALAASVTIAFFIGWQASRRMAREMVSHSQGSAVSGVMPTTADHASTSARVGSGAPASSHSSPDLQFAGTSPQAGSPLQGDVAASPAGEQIAADAITEALQSPDRFVPIDRRIPRELQDLEQRGLLRLESREGFVPVLLKDGSTAVVPFQQIDVRPKRNAY